MKKIFRMVFVLFFVTVCFFVLTNMNSGEIEKKAGKSEKTGQKIQKKEKKEPTAQERREAIKKSFEEKRVKVYLPAVEANIKKLEKGFKEKTLGYGFEFTISDLSRAGDSRAVPILTKILLEYDLQDKRTRDKSSSADVREAAARALGMIGDESAIPALRKAITNELDLNVKMASIEALGEAAEEDIISFLREILNDENEQKIRVGCHFAIFQIKLKQKKNTNIKGKEIQAYKELSKDEDDWVKFYAAWKIVTKQDFLYPDERDIKEAIFVLQELSTNSEDKSLRKSSDRIMENYKGK